MPLTETEKTELLAIARKAIEAALSGGQATDAASTSPGLAEERGAFVTLHKLGQLRGCIGTFSSDKPLYRTVSEMAVSAATKDPRFPPLAPEELGDIDIEISALTPLREITDVGEIEIGRHGIYIMKGGNAGVLLPQVAVEHAMDKLTFLEHTCMKAGLPEGAWKEGARILVFEAEVFGEIK